jgi:hypothetical protein
MVSQLEELAQRLGITVRYETLKGEGLARAGGFCRVNGRDMLIIHKQATQREKIGLLAQTLKRYDLTQVYILPSLRQLLDIGDGQ